MFISLLTLVSALFLSSVAIYYSVTGMVAIFPAQATAITIMGVAIEVGKLVTVLWLHKHWDTKLIWLKSLLIVSAIGVMFLTSMGIFGFLSKSHVEQTAAADENIAQVERIESDIARQRAIIARAEERVKGLENNTTGVDSSLQNQIDREQERITTAYERVQPAIDAELKIIEAEDAKIKDRVASYTKQIDTIDSSLANLQSALETSDIRTAQSIVGAKVDGQLGANTSAKITAYRQSAQDERERAQQEIERIKAESSPARTAAQAEIERIRARVETEIQQSNQLIAKLKGQLGQTSRDDIDADLEKQIVKINEANDTLDELLQNKAAIEVQTRKLEAEVGPIKYIAEFIYSDDVNKNLLEEAVRWVIVLIIFVFDPLAVLLLIASQYSFEQSRAQKELKQMVHDEVVEEVERVEREHHKEPTEEMPSELVFVVDPPEPEPIMPENETIAEHEITTRHNITVWPTVEEIIEPEVEETLEEETLAEVVEFPKKPEPKIKTVSLTKVADDYVNYNGKVFQTQALIKSHRELKLDFDSPVKSGTGFPGFAKEGDLFLRTDAQPTKLYRFNGHVWDDVDKNLLNYSAYTAEYINVLIEKIGANEYNPELLNNNEKKHIEAMLSQE